MEIPGAQPEVRLQAAVREGHWRIRAEVLYGLLVDGDPPDPTTPEQIAADMNLPVEAVREAIAYCEECPEDIERDHAAEEARLKATGMMDEDGNYTGQYKNPAS